MIAINYIKIGLYGKICVVKRFLSCYNSTGEKRKTHVKSCLLAAMEGNWHKAKCIYDKHPDDISAVFSEQKNRALDVTAAANRTNFVKNLVNYLSGEDLLALKNDRGCTAFYYAAASGNLDLVKMMMEKKNGEQLTNIPGFDSISLLSTPQGSPKKKERKEKDNIWPHRNILPLQAAAMSSHREMVRHLYDKTLVEDVGDRIELLVTLIKIDLYGKHYS